MFGHEKQLVRSPNRSLNGGSGLSTNPSGGEMEYNLSVNQEALPVAVPVNPGAQLLINACGRTVGVEMQCARSIMDLQSALQAVLQMEAQAFQFFDVQGTTLATDSDIHEAIAKGQTPLVATLTDASIHFIENRREELAQMQWKLVRDQLTATTGQIAALKRQVSETQAQVEAHKSESADFIDRVHKEALRAVESERDVAQCECRQLAERVSAVAQLVASERQKRDVALQGIEKQLSGLRDMLESERGARRQDLGVHMSMVNDAKAQIEAEKTAREALEDKHAFDIHTVMEKVEAFQRHITEMLQDQHMEAAKTVEGMNNQFQGHVRQIGRVRGDLEGNSQEMKVRFGQIEERCVNLENRINEVSGRGTSGIDRISERHERVAQVVESLRLEEKQNQNQIQAAINRIKDLENSMHETELATREICQKEREGRDDQFRRLQLGLASAQQRQISELEEKIADRFERESSERERNVQQIYEEVNKGSPKIRSVGRGFSAGSGPGSGAFNTPTRVEVMTTSAMNDSFPISTPAAPVPALAAVPAGAPTAAGPPAIALPGTAPALRASLGGGTSMQMSAYPATMPMSPPMGTRMTIRPPDAGQMLSAGIISNTQSSNGSSRGPSVSVAAAPGAPVGRRMLSPGPMRQSTR